MTLAKVLSTCVLGFTFASFVSNDVFAQEKAKVRFHEPSVVYSGNGCPDGTASKTLSPDWGSLSFLFDVNRLELPGSFRANQIFGSPEVSCEISAYVFVSAGYRPKALRVDYRGAVEVANGSHFKIMTRVQYNSKNSTNSKIVDVVHEQDGPLSMELMSTQILPFKNLECGESIVVRMRSTIQIENYTTASDDMSLISLDSADSILGSNIVLRPEFEACKPKK